MPVRFLTFLKVVSVPTIVSLFVSIFFASGYMLVTPKRSIDAVAAMSAHTDSVLFQHNIETDSQIAKTDRKHQAEIDTLSRRLNRQETLLTAIARGQCLDRPSREWKLMGLPCNDLLRGRQ